MLKRNKVLVAFMLVAVLCMSIGFAAISDTLNVTGSMAMDETLLNTEFDKNVVFVNPAKDVANVSKSEVSADGDTYTFAIDAAAFTKATDSVTLTVDIQNNNAADATVEINGDKNEGAMDQFITVTHSLSGTNVTANGGKVTLTIVVTLDTIPENVGESTITFTINAKPAN